MIWFKAIAIKQAMVMPDPPNNNLTTSGNAFIASGTWLNPSPNTKDSPMMSLALSFKGSEVRMSMPVNVIWEKIMTVAPPITAGGIVEIKAPILGIRPAKIKNPAPRATTYRLMTFVNAIIPTFWLNEVLGKELKIAPRDEVNPLAKIGRAHV